MTANQLCNKLRAYIKRRDKSSTPGPSEVVVEDDDGTRYSVEDVHLLRGVVVIVIDKSDKV